MLADIGYTHIEMGIHADTCRVLTEIVPQSADVALGLDMAYERRRGNAWDAIGNQGAGNQGMMFSFACHETEDLMPMPIWLTHRLARKLAELRISGQLPLLRPGAKT